MAQTTLLSSVTKTTDYPVEVSVSADNNCGTVIVKYDTPYTKQMFYELPNITINIYLDDVLYESRAISLEITDENIAVGNILTDIPKSCKFSIIPNFDNSALDAHNEALKTDNMEYFGYIPSSPPTHDWHDDLWTTPTETFPITLVWDDTNVSASGGGGGGGGSTPTASDVSYDNSTSGLNATNVQTAIDKLNITLTQEEYDNLPEADKNNGSYYFIIKEDGE